MGEFDKSYQLTCYIKDDKGQLQQLFTAPSSNITLTKKPTLWERLKSKFTKKETPYSYSWSMTTNKQIELR